MQSGKRQGKQRQGKRHRKLFFAAFLLAAACALSGCGGEETPEGKTEIGIDGYVYLPEKLTTSVRGGYTLPDGFDKPVEADGSLFFRKSISGSYAIGKASPDWETGKTQLETAEDVFVVSGEGILLEDIAQMPEEAVMSLLDIAVEKGVSNAQKGAGGTVTVDPDARYGRFYLLDYAVDQEQNIYLILQYSEGDYFDMEQRGYLVCRQSAAGEWVWRTFYPDLEPVAEGCLAVDGQGGAYVLTQEGILAVGNQGQRGETVRTDAFKDTGFSECLVGDIRGNVYYLLEKNYGEGCKWLRVESAGQESVRLQEAGEIFGEDWVSGKTVYDGSLYLSYSMTGRLCRYHAASPPVSEAAPAAMSGGGDVVLKWLESNMSSDSVREIIFLGPENILVWYEETGEKGLFLLSKTPVEEMPERELVTLAVFGADSSLEEIIARFNRRNKEYYVVLADYGYPDGETDGARVRMDAALASSDPPDLVDLAGRDLRKDMEKGLLEDLTPYLAREGEPDREDFLENVLAGYTVDGKLAGIPLAFNITVTAGRLSQTDYLESWTMEDVYALTERYPDRNLLGDGTGGECNTRDNLLGGFCSDYYLEAFVDWEEGTCSFDSDDFRKLLLWVEKYGKETPEASGTAYYTRGYMSEEDLLMENWLSFEGGAEWETMFGEEIRLLGYPTVDGKGCAHLRSDDPFGIVAGADNKEGAWEFLKYYLMQEADYYPFSSRKSVMQKRMEKATKQDYVGEEPRPVKWLILGNDSVPCYATRQELADQIMEFIEQMDFNAASAQRNEIIHIVTEEAEHYYRGNKSLDEVVDIIQSRVRLMLQENM